MIGTPDWMAKREEIYAQRNKRIQEVCKHYSNMYANPAKGGMFWFDVKNHLAICIHAKVGRKEVNFPSLV